MKKSKPEKIMSALNVGLIFFLMLGSVSPVLALQETETPTATPTPTRTNTPTYTPTFYYPSVTSIGTLGTPTGTQVGGANPRITPISNWDCPSSPPVGWGTVTPSNLWSFACGQCIGSDGSWGNFFPVQTATKTQIPTPTIKGALTPTQTRTATATGTPVVSYKTLSLPDDVRLSYYWASQLDPSDHVHIAFTIPDSNSGYAVGWTQTCTRSGAWPGILRMGYPTYGVAAVMTWIDNASAGSCSSGERCYEHGADASGHCAAMGYTMTDNDGFDGTFAGGEELVFELYAGQATNWIEWHAWDFNVRYSSRGYEYQTETAVYNATAIALDNSSLCGVVGDIANEQQAFSWTGLGAIIHLKVCYSLGPFNALLFQVPYITTFCFDAQDAGILTLFNVSLYMDVIFVMIFAVVLVTMFRR